MAPDMFRSILGVTVEDLEIDCLKISGSVNYT